MNNLLQYMGYTGTVEYSAEDNILHGRVIGIRGLLSYEGDSVATLRNDFEEAVDFYLSTCKERDNELIATKDAYDKDLKAV